jgi:iron-sulfur cluster assembly accessory protein
MKPGGRLLSRRQSSPYNPGEKQMSVSDETAVTTDGIILSDAAAAKVKSLLEQEGREDLALRVAVQPGGCSGLRYQLFFDERSLDGDVVKEFDGVRVVTDRMSAPYLGGASIDFVDTIEKQGFTIDNPNATGSCASGVPREREGVRGAAYRRGSPSFPGAPSGSRSPSRSRTSRSPTGSSSVTSTAMSLATRTQASPGGWGFSVIRTVTFSSPSSADAPYSPHTPPQKWTVSVRSPGAYSST